MTNLEKLESISQEVSKFSIEQRSAFLSYLTGSLKSHFKHKNVNDKSVFEAYVIALELVKNESK